MARWLGWLVVAVVVFAGAPAFGQSGSITYQGSLEEAGGFADGSYDMVFRLFSSASGGSSLAAVSVDGVEVDNGLFSVELDFGDVFDAGSERYLEVSVKPGGAMGFDVLSPRVRLTSAPAANVAAFADEAAFAQSGPFAPVDTTPVSDDGVSGMVVSVEVDFDGDLRTDLSLGSVVGIERQVIFPVTPGGFSDFVVELRVPYQAGSPFRGYFEQLLGSVDVLVRCTAQVTNETVYLFEDGVVSGWGLGYDGTFVETVEVTFDVQGSLTGAAGRVSSGFDGFGTPPFEPRLGGESGRPGSNFFEFAGYRPVYSNVGDLPRESVLIVNGMQTGGRDEPPVELVLNVFDDRTNELWGRFSSGVLSTLRLVDELGGTVWEPTGGGPRALLSSWELRETADGGLIEVYGITYSTQFVP